MKILALEFSSEERSVAVLADRHSAGQPGGAEAVAEPIPIVSSLRAAPRTLNAFKLIEDTLAKAGWEREEVECVAVGLGPGSYTGIRAAISIAQAWQLARDTRLLGVSSVEALAAQGQAEGLTGRVTLVIDAQKHEVYLATYNIQPATMRLLEPLRLGTAAEILARAKAGDTLAGPEIGRWIPEGRVLIPQAGALAGLAKTRTDFTAGEQLEPIYLRETSFVKAPPPRALPAGLL